MSKKSALYGEIVSYVNEVSRWTWISVSQLTSLLFGVAYLVICLLETQHIRFTNVYAFWAAYWAVGGFLFVMQLASFIYFYSSNTKRDAKEPGGYYGSAFLRDVQLAFFIYTIWFIILTGSSASWLVKFGKTIGDSAPTVGLEPEWRVFNNLYNVAVSTTFIYIYVTMRAVIGHFNPLRITTLWYLNKSKSKVAKA
jgi:hypothetical protein